MPAAPCAPSTVIDLLCQGASQAGSSAFSAGATSALDAMSSWVSSGASWFLGQVGGLLGRTTAVDLSAPWFLGRYRAVEAVLAVVALPLLLASAVQAVLRQDPGSLVRIALVQLPLAMLLSGAAVELTAIGLKATDQLSSSISGGSSGTLRSLTDELARALVSSSATTGSGAPSFVLLLASLGVALAGLLLWVELVMRSAAIYVAVAFLPLVLLTMIWPALAGWSRRLTETLCVLVLSKLVVVVVLAMAVGALGTRSGRGFATLVTGIALLLFAAFAPFTLLKLLPLAEGSAAGHLEGMRQRAWRSASTGAPRRLAEVALGQLGGELAMPAAPAAAGPRLGGAGVRSSEDPLAGAARPRPRPGGGAAPSSPPPAPAPAAPTASAADPSGAPGRRRPSEPSPAPGRAAPTPAGSVPGDGQPRLVMGPGGWPRDADEDEEAEPAPAGRPARRPAELRPSSLVIERDEIGPLIRPRRTPTGGDDG